MGTADTMAPGSLGLSDLIPTLNENYYLTSLSIIKHNGIYFSKKNTTEFIDQ